MEDRWLTVLSGGATHWEGAARDLARMVAALQMPYSAATARLDAIIADLGNEDLHPELFPDVSPIGGGPQK